MESTDGLTRGMEVLDTGRPISVPVGKETLGRVFNVLGDTIDLDQPFPEDAPRDSIHKKLHPLTSSPLQKKFLKQGSRLLTSCPLFERWEGRTLRRCRSWEDRLDSRINP